MLGFTREAFVTCGVPDADAASIAAAMIEADLTGADAHGIFRLAQYVGVLRDGRINAKPQIKVVERGPATALIDGDNGMGHLVMTYAANLAVELARESGIGWVGARRSNHAGAAGAYATIPLAHDFIGIYGAVSSANHMAPWGGAEPLLGTNPIAVAIPAGAEAPVVLDIATSIASFGTIRTHVLEGRPMPEGWIVDRATGKPITDPKKVPDGVLLPIGDYKGSGLAIIIGLLAGRAQRRGLRPRRARLHRRRDRRVQHRAVHGRARCRALRAAREFHGRDRSPHPRAALLGEASRLRSESAFPARSADGASRTAPASASSSRRRS